MKKNVGGSAGILNMFVTNGDAIRLLFVLAETRIRPDSQCREREHALTPAREREAGSRRSAPAALQHRALNPAARLVLGKALVVLQPATTRA